MPDTLKPWFEKFEAQKGETKTPEQGASTSVWAAVAPELDGVGGKYLENCQISKLSTPERISDEYCGHTAYAVNLDNALKLWDLSKKLTNTH